MIEKGSGVFYMLIILSNTGSLEFERSLFTFAPLALTTRTKITVQEQSSGLKLALQDIANHCVS